MSIEQQLEGLTAAIIRLAAAQEATASGTLLTIEETTTVAGAATTAPPKPAGRCTPKAERLKGHKRNKCEKELDAADEAAAAKQKEADDAAALGLEPPADTPPITEATFTLAEVKAVIKELAPKKGATALVGIVGKYGINVDVVEESDYAAMIAEMNASPDV